MVRVKVRVRIRASVSIRVRVEDISVKTQASSVNPLKNSCYLVDIRGGSSSTYPYIHITD